MNFIKNWQGLTALLIGVAAFFGFPYLAHWYDPTAGSFDPGFLQRPVLAFVYLAFGHFIIWLFIQIDWPTLDRWLDSGGFDRMWNSQGQGMSNWARFLIVMAMIVFEMAFYLACLFAVPQ